MNSRNFNVRLSEDLIEWLDQRARRERRSRNELIRMTLEDLKAGKLVPQQAEEKEVRVEPRRTVVNEAPELRAAF